MNINDPITVATQSYMIKEIIRQFKEETGAVEGIEFALHDFGYRGSTSVESAGIGGAAHLVNFLGTDTLAACELLAEYYDEEMAGFSIPATEHSTMTSWGRDNELEAYRNLLEEYPTGVIACVSDSYDIFHACEKLWGEELKEEVLNRDGVLVVRPDSGDPVDVILRILDILGDKFGYEKNEKGYKVLHPKVRIIQGDGVDIESIYQILYFMKLRGWSADNIAFGSGGALLQKLDRDTFKWAIKCCAVKRSGEWRDVYKEPITSKGKNSKRGRLRLEKVNGEYSTVLEDETNENCTNQELQTVFLNGETVNTTTLEKVRSIVNGKHDLLSSV